MKRYSTAQRVLKVIACAAWLSVASYSNAATSDGRYTNRAYDEGLVLEETVGIDTIKIQQKSPTHRKSAKDNKSGVDTGVH